MIHHKNNELQTLYPFSEKYSICISEKHCISCYEHSPIFLSRRSEGFFSSFNIVTMECPVCKIKYQIKEDKPTDYG